MAVGLEVQGMAMLFALTTLFLLVNFALFFARGRSATVWKRVAGASVAAGTGIGVASFFVIVALAERYDPQVLLQSWALTVGWAFLFSLLAACVTIFEIARNPDGMAAFTLNTIALLLLGFTFAHEFIFPDGLTSFLALPPLTTNLLNLAASLFLTGILRQLYLKKHALGRPPLAAAR